jgi:hypothetical protein
MAEELTIEEVNQIALGIARQGGKRGRAIFYRYCFEMQEEFPEFVAKIMEEVLPAMPEQDRKIILFCLDEWGKAGKVDIAKIASEEIENAIFKHLTK